MKVVLSSKCYKKLFMQYYALYRNKKEERESDREREIKRNIK